MNIIPVCYCGNRKIFGGIFLSVLSMLRHTDAALEILLLTMDLSDENPLFLPFSEEQRTLLERTLREKNPASSVRVIDVTAHHKTYFSNGKNNKNAYTPYASIRLFLDLLEVPDKIVYLDADVMCCGDVAEYFNHDINNHEFAATLDVVGHRFFPRKYCNSGVLLLNLPKIRETGLFEKARVRVSTRWMLMPDQSALNMLSVAKLVLPYRFNEQRSIKPDTVFKHFCKGFRWRGPILTTYNIKQWQRDRVHNELGIQDFDEIYAQYDAICSRDRNDALIGI